MRAQKPADRYRRWLNRISVPELAQAWPLTEDRRNERQIVKCPDDMHCFWSFDDGYRIKHLDTVTEFLRESYLFRICLHDVNCFLGSEVLSLRSGQSAARGNLIPKRPIDPIAGVRKRRTAANVSSLSPRLSHGSRRAGIRNHRTACSDRFQRRSASRYLLFCPDFFKLGDGSPISGRKAVYASQNDSRVSQYLHAVRKFGTAENQEVVISHFKPRGFSGTVWQVRNVFRATFRFSIPNCPALFMI